MQMNFATRVLVLSLLTLGFTACSATSSGGQKGDGIPTFSDEDLALAEGQRYGDGSIPQAREGGLFQDVYFEYDSAVVLPEYQEMIRQNAVVLQKDTSLHAEVEGHCDRRGTNEYNLALGEERAKAVAALMVSFGATPSQISTISYGEEIPLDPAEGENAFAKNRRAHFALYRVKKDN